MVKLSKKELINMIDRCIYSITECKRQDEFIFFASKKNNGISCNITYSNGKYTIKIIGLHTHSKLLVWDSNYHNTLDQLSAILRVLSL
jgi:hypothetical protein